MRLQASAGNGVRMSKPRSEDPRQKLLTNLKGLRRSGRPFLLDVDGKMVVVQDAKAYQKLLDSLDYAEAVAGIKRGLASFARGEGRPARAALEEALKSTKARLAKGRGKSAA